MNNPTPPVEVTQADREAAIELATIIFGNGHSLIGLLRTRERHFMLDAFARHRIASTRTVDTELIDALKACLTFLTTTPLESGYCCCGDTVDGHNLGSGHAPVDDLSYYAGQVAEKARSGITKAEAGL